MCELTFSVFDEGLCRRTVFAHNWARSHHVGLERVIWQPELAASAEATAMAQGTDDARAATDPPDPDLLTTRFKNLRSGSVKKIFLTNLMQKFVHFTFVVKFLTKYLV